MKSKTLKFSLIALAVISMVACGQKPTNPLEEYSKPNSENILPNYLFIENSDCETVRIYTIETNDAAIHYNKVNYLHLVQFRHQEEVFIKELPDFANSNFFVDKIYSIEGETQTFYLVRFTMGIFAQGSHYWQVIKAYEIDNNGNFSSKKLFKTKKENLDEIEISWSYGNIDEDSIESNKNIVLRKEGKGDEIIYCDTSKTLYIPLIVEVSGGNAMTDKNLVYQWKGDDFEYIGIR